WRALALQGAKGGEDDLEAYGSPIVATLEGVKQVVVNTVKGLAGVDARSGEPLWLVGVDRGDVDAPNVTPALWNRQADHLVLTTTESSGSPLFRITKAGREWNAEEVWRSKVSGNMASPVVAGDHAFLPLKNGRVALLDLSNGKEAWISKPLFASYASAVRRDDRVLLLTADGELHLLATDQTQLRKLGVLKVAERTWAHLAAQDDRVYVRSQSSLIALEWVTSRRREPRAEEVAEGGSKAGFPAGH
ncbi:MAG: PQQ-binding-like beta-propeller repeat protein, partial [Acidobacteriota bacterium]